MSESSAIQTEYNGYLFRSRLEARWAIFLDRMNIAYNYESEGFELGGLRYLPDFHLKDGMQLHGEKERLRNVWVEIKPSMTLEEQDRKKISKFVQKTGNVLLLITGDPEPNAEMRLISHAKDGGGWATPFVRWLELGDGQAGLLKLEGQAVGMSLGSAVEPLTRTDRLMAAYGAARKARFEYGETPEVQSFTVARDCRRCGKPFVPRREYYRLCTDCYWVETAHKRPEQTSVAVAPQGINKRATFPRWVYGIVALPVVVVLLFAGLIAMADGRTPNQDVVAAGGSNSEDLLAAGEGRPTETVEPTKEAQIEPDRPETERAGAIVDYGTGGKQEQNNAAEPGDMETEAAEAIEKSAKTPLPDGTVQPTSRAAPTWTREPTKIPTATQTETSTPAPTDAPTATPRPTNTPEPTKVPTRDTPLVRVNAASVNLRDGPGTRYGIVDVGLQEAEYEVLGKTESGEWFNVKAKNGPRFWIAASVVDEIVSGSTSRVGVVATIPAPPEPTRAPLPTATSVPPTATAFVPTATAVPVAPTEPPPPPAPAPAENCTPGYSPCIPIVSDADCAGGSGNGPYYVPGPVTVDWAYGDPYGLDRDKDGVGCE